MDYKSPTLIQSYLMTDVTSAAMGFLSGETIDGGCQSDNIDDCISDTR